MFPTAKVEGGEAEAKGLLVICSAVGGMEGGGRAISAFSEKEACVPGRGDNGSCDMEDSEGGTGG